MRTPTSRRRLPTPCVSNWTASKPEMQATETFGHTASTQAMRLPGYLIAFVLVLLLASTTPVGTGSGAHQFDLLHPLFSHVHVVDGRVVTHEQQLAEQSSGNTE